MSDAKPLPPPDLDFLSKFEPGFRFLTRYHRHRVVGLEHVPEEGRVLVVVNHSFATYDTALLGWAIHQHTGRVLRGLGDRAIFRTPFLKDWAQKSGAVRGGHDAAERLLLANEDLVMVAPGGMREALRPSDERYRLRWERRRGFVRLAIKTGSPVLLAACPRADEIYTVYENNLTKLIYKTARLPAPLIRGMGLTLLPRPVPLTHWLSPLIPPPAVDPADDAALDAATDEFHEQLTQQMETLMARGVESRW